MRTAQTEVVTRAALSDLSCLVRGRLVPELLSRSIVLRATGGACFPLSLSDAFFRQSRAQSRRLWDTLSATREWKRKATLSATPERDVEMVRLGSCSVTDWRVQVENKVGEAERKAAPSSGLSDNVAGKYHESELRICA